jgi:hypothetical protein
VKQIKKFFKRDAFEKLMYGHVNALVTNMPFTIDKAVMNFMSCYDLNNEGLSKESLKVTYYRMQKEYFDTTKTENEQAK